MHREDLSPDELKLMEQIPEAARATILRLGVKPSEYLAELAAEKAGDSASSDSIATRLGVSSKEQKEAGR
jgi:hypothetical protein